MSKYSVSGYLVAKYPFEVLVDESSKEEAKAVGIEKAREDIEKHFNITTEKQAVSVRIVYACNQKEGEHGFRKR